MHQIQNLREFRDLNLEMSQLRPAVLMGERLLVSNRTVMQ